MTFEYDPMKTDWSRRISQFSKADWKIIKNEYPDEIPRIKELGKHYGAERVVILFNYKDAPIGHVVLHRKEKILWFV